MKKQPVLQIPDTQFDRMLDAGALLLAGLSLLIAITQFGSLPEQIPTHFDLSGNADRFSSKSFIFFLPGISAAIVIAILILSRYPHLFNYPYKITEENAPFEYRKARIMLKIVNVLTALLFLIITWNMVQSANSQPKLGGLFWVVLVALTVAPIAVLVGWKRPK